MLDEIENQKFGEQELEALINDNNKQKELEIQKCQEAFYIKWICFVVVLFTGYGVLCTQMPDPFFKFMPIFRSNESFRYFVLTDKLNPVTRGDLLVNDLSFIIINYLELAFMYI